MLATTLFAALFRTRDALPEEGIARVQTLKSKAVFALRMCADGSNVVVLATFAQNLKLLTDKADDAEGSRFVASVDNGSGSKKSFTITQFSSREVMPLAFAFRSNKIEISINSKVSSMNVSVPIRALPNSTKFEFGSSSIGTTKKIVAEDEMVLHIP